MNKKRREILERIGTLIGDAMSDLGEVKDEEEEYRDSIPENLREGEKYEVADSAVNEMEEALGHLEEAIGNIENAIGG